MVAFAIAAALSLYSTHLSSECLGCQLDIVRMFNRLESNRWKPDEQEVNRGFVIDRQHAQKKFLDAIKESSGSAAIMLGAGAGEQPGLSHGRSSTCSITPAQSIAELALPRSRSGKSTQRVRPRCVEPTRNSPYSVPGPLKFSIDGILGTSTVGKSAVF